MNPRDLEPDTINDLLGLFLGECLGSGIARHVFVFKFNSDYVVKIEHGEEDFQNIAEWELWRTASDTLRKHLAPCIMISKNGKVLIQRRTEECPTHLLPRKMPAVLGDLHAENFGIIDGAVVARDYGRHRALAMTANAKAMRKVYYDRAS